MQRTWMTGGQCHVDVLVLEVEAEKKVGIEATLMIVQLQSGMLM